MGSYSIDIDKGVENVKRLLEYGEKHGITEFNELLAVYHNSTGLAEKLEDARAGMWLSEYLESPQAEEQRRRYREMLEREEPESGQEELYAETRKRAGAGKQEQCPAECHYPGRAGLFQEQP